MQFSQIAFAAVIAASSAMAQDLSQIPSCALTPAVAAIGSTGCSTSDYECICKSTTFLSDINTAIQTTCTAAEIATVTSFATALCSPYGINLGSNSTSAAVASGAASATAGVAAPTGATVATTNGTSTGTSSSPSATFTGAASVQKVGGLLMAIGLMAAL